MSTEELDKAQRLAKFKPGDHVLYIPGHAYGDRAHPDCERGVVCSVGKFVFVQYGTKRSIEATDVEDLVHLEERLDR